MERGKGFPLSRPNIFILTLLLEGAAIAWMCGNQLGRRNLNEMMRLELMHQEYEALKKSVGAPESNSNAQKQSAENQHLVFKNDKASKTRQILADKHGVSSYVIESAVEFGRGLDAAEEVSPNTKLAAPSQVGLITNS